MRHVDYHALKRTESKDAKNSVCLCMQQTTVVLHSESFQVFLDQGADGGWSAHTREPEVVGGLGDSRDGALKDWQVAMIAWLVFHRETAEC